MVIGGVWLDEQESAIAMGLMQHVIVLHDCSVLYSQNVQLQNNWLSFFTIICITMRVQEQNPHTGRTAYLQGWSHFLNDLCSFSHS